MTDEPGASRHGAEPTSPPLRDRRAPAQATAPLRLAALAVVCAGALLGTPAGAQGPPPPAASPAAPAAPAGASPAAGSASVAPDANRPASAGTRTMLARPGTSIEADALSGNTGNRIFVFRGNVVLHSDPSIDRTLGAATERSDPLTVTADEIDVDQLQLTYVAKGHVHFVQGDRNGRADTAMLDEQTHDLDLIGHADVAQGDRRAVADKMTYNTASRRFAGAGDVRLYQPLPPPAPRASSTPAPKHRLRLPL